MRPALPIALAILAFGWIGCAHVHRHDAPAPPAPVLEKHGKGPPSHAPAHGYRRQLRDGVELVFDGGLGLWVVVGYEGHFHDGQRYYRQWKGHWQASIRLGDGWVRVTSRELPPGLRVKDHKGLRKRGAVPANHGP